MESAPGHAFAVAALVLADMALTDAPKLHAASSSVNSAAVLVVSFDEYGLGNTYIDHARTTARLRSPLF